MYFNYCLLTFCSRSDLVELILRERSSYLSSRVVFCCGSSEEHFNSFDPKQTWAVHWIFVRVRVMFMLVCPCPGLNSCWFLYPNSFSILISSYPGTDRLSGVCCSRGQGPAWVQFYRTTRTHLLG